MAAAASAAVYFTAYYTRTLELAKPLVWMVFFATIFGYNLQRILKYWKSSSGESPHQLWILKNRILILVTCIVSLQVVLIVVARHLDLFLLWWPEALISFLAVILYSFPIYKGKGLRHIPGIKIFLVAGVWTLITAWLPIQLAVQLDDTTKTYLLADRFCFILLLCIPFDIRDLKFDEATMKTIPQVIGARTALYLSMALALALAFLPLWLAPDLFPPAVILYGAVIFCLYQTLYVGSKLYHLLVLDGLILLQAVSFLFYLGFIS